jgi:hypothetical protein|nr:MAG TPA: hypothetical protein [Caudoviricetes sp.]DAQ45798.1 MAG TPA: hypothetical protein [Caudoviricetes sp.]
MAAMVALDIVMGIMTTMVMVVDAKKGGNYVLSFLKLF